MTKIKIFVVPEKENYQEMVNNHYDLQAEKHGTSLESTIGDMNIRRLEIENLTKYLKNNKKCLEVGCGNGAATIEISKIKKLDLTSIEPNKKLFSIAQQQDVTDILGKINFLNENILKFYKENTFEQIFSIRCIINLLTKNDQKNALSNMARSLQPGGDLILLEAFSDGLKELNLVRNELDLENLPGAPHNLHLDKIFVIEHLENENLEFVHEDNFLSSYYFFTRALYPAITKLNNSNIVKNSKIDYFFSFFPPYGNFAHIKILKFRKK